jgi:hypothetical protein
LLLRNEDLSSHETIVLLLLGYRTGPQTQALKRTQRLGTEGLEEKLRSVPQPQQPNRLLELIAERTVTGRTTLVAEIGRASPSETSEQLAERAVEYVKWGEVGLLLPEFLASHFLNVSGW